MIKPPKTALFAAVVATGVACSGGESKGDFPKDVVGSVAMPAEPDIEPHKVGKFASPDDEPEAVGTEAVPDLELDAKEQPHKVGSVAAPKKPYPGRDAMPGKPVEPPSTEAVEK